MQHCKAWNFYTFVISNNQSFIFDVLKVVDCVGEKFDLISPLQFDTRKDSDLKPQKSSFT